MKNNWLKILVAVSALLIAGSAAYFSITGLGILFSGAAIAVMVMAGSLEFAKLVSATYLKQRWDEIKGFNKWYLSFAVGILMVITSAGIFGYLSNAFQQQNLKLDQVAREVQVWQNKIDYTNQQIATLQGQQKDLSTTQNTLITKGNVNNRLLRSVDNRDRQSNTINKKINTLQDSIVAYNGHINDIKNNNIGIEREVGGFRFVAESFGMELNTVVKFFIILIVVVFDPLAIALVIAFNQLIMTPKKKEDEEVDVRHKVEEYDKIKLSEEDLRKIEDVLMNPPKPNEELKRAKEDYDKKIMTQHEWNLERDKMAEKLKQEEILAEMMKQDQELGLYDNDWEPTISDNFTIGPDGAYEREDEEFSNIEPSIEDEEENFSTIEPNIENIFHDNFTESEITEEISENVKQDEPEVGDEKKN